ncbi:hypothetical protein L3X38_015804 [Prunus dulcis]|uniref:Uncharacterized protein n=1 Tax=Prunus dulcis TaxID=3755 RepID=A0AAD4W4S6_PRUDU|nr:hypothetical protein L3X38_015804 [Prunus dulcis]
MNSNKNRDLTKEWETRLISEQAIETLEGLPLTSSTVDCNLQMLLLSSSLCCSEFYTFSLSTECSCSNGGNGVEEQNVVK